MTGALGRVVRAGVGRRRIPTLAMAVTTMLAVTASVLAAGLLIASRAPFDRAFAKQRGAHLTIQFAGGTAEAGAIGATAHLAGVTAAGGPYPVQSPRPTVGANRSGMPVGDHLPPMTIAGRAAPTGPVDTLDLTDGRWLTGSGQVVLTAVNSPLSVGDHMSFPDLPGSPTLTVVGLARSVTGTADAWVSPAQLAALTPPGATPAYQMLYRFTHAETDAQVAADRATVAAAAPPGSMTSAASYLKVKLAADRTSAAFVPFVSAFGVLGLGLSVLIIGVVVSSTVGASTRRIGILKSLGFTPAQIVRAYVGQALIPATAGTGLGTVCGNLLSIPVMGRADAAFNAGTLTLAPWIDLVVPAGALAAVAATAFVPALRAGRLPTVQALTAGRTSREGRGRAAARLLGRLPLPRPVSLGLAMPFARPARSAIIIAAVAFGTIAVTFGVGLAVSLSDVQEAVNRSSPGAVVIQTFGAPAAAVPGSTQTTAPGLTAADPAAIEARLRTQPGTRRYFTTGQTRVSVAGLAGTTTVIAYEGDSSWGSYQMLSGSWFHRPGEAVVPTGFLTATGTHVGDTITLADNGHTARVRIVGEAFALREEGMLILTDTATLKGLDAYILPESIEFDIDLTRGTNTQSYVGSLNTALQSLGVTAQPNTGHLSSSALAMEGLTALLSAMLVAVAGLGVLTTVVLDTRERVRDFGILKALGMSPRQTIGTVLTSVTLAGVVGDALGVPIGAALHHVVLPAMGHAAGARIPAAETAVYHLPVLLPLALGGLLIAAAGALAPAGWAAHTHTAVALRTE